MDEAAGDSGGCSGEELAQGLRRAYDAPILNTTSSDATVDDVQESLDDLMAKMKSM